MSYVIIFWDNSKVQVSDSTGEKLKDAIREQKIKTFELEKSMYSVSGVNKIIPKKEAYDVFPQEWELLQSMSDKKAESELVGLGSGQLAIGEEIIDLDKI